MPSAAGLFRRAIVQSLPSAFFSDELARDIAGAIAAESMLRPTVSDLRAAWTAFATTGDPGWPPYDTQRRLVQIFDADPVVTAYPEETSRRLWQNHRFQALPLLTAQPDCSAAGEAVHALRLSLERRLCPKGEMQ